MIAPSRSMIAASSSVRSRAAQASVRSSIPPRSSIRYSAITAFHNASPAGPNFRGGEMAVVSGETSEKGGFPGIFAMLYPPIPFPGKFFYKNQAVNVGLVLLKLRRRRAPADGHLLFFEPPPAHNRPIKRAAVRRADARR